MLLQVSEKPFDIRVIVPTNIPDMNMPWEEDSRLYYMIDRSTGRGPAIKDETGEWKTDDEGHHIYEEGELYEGWHVSDNFGNGAEFPTSGDVLRFFDRVNEATETDPYVESF